MNAGSDVTAAPGLNRRDRFVTIASLIGLAAIAWLYLWWDAQRMAGMSMPGEGMTMPVWGIEPLLLTFLMWSVMMVGMMLPSATPAILMYGSMSRKQSGDRPILPSVWLFTAGYLLVWAGFSVAATVLQAFLVSNALLTPMMASASHWLTGGLLVAAGIYQWLPVKSVCLEKCRAPLQFFLFHWRPGRLGALRMGAEHGAFCLGCCWVLMLLLFTLGVMNLLWVALIAGFILVEKLLSAGAHADRIAGIGLVIAGVATVFAGS